MKVYRGVSLTPRRSGARRTLPADVGATMSIDLRSSMWSSTRLCIHQSEEGQRPRPTNAHLPRIRLKGDAPVRTRVEGPVRTTSGACCTVTATPSAPDHVGTEMAELELGGGLVDGVVRLERPAVALADDLEAVEAERPVVVRSRLPLRDEGAQAEGGEELGEVLVLRLAGLAGVQHLEGVARGVDGVVQPGRGVGPSRVGGPLAHGEVEAVEAHLDGQPGLARPAALREEGVDRLELLVERHLAQVGQAGEPPRVGRGRRLVRSASHVNACTSQTKR